MLLVPLALLVAQEPFQGAGFTVDYVPESMVPQEITTEDVYLFQLLDPKDPVALCPPLRVTTYLDTEKLGDGAELMRHTRNRTVAALKGRGLQPTGFGSYEMVMLGSYDTVSYFECTHEDGSSWLYLFRGYRLDGHLMVLTACRPTDKESVRYGNVQRAMESLDWLGIDESTHIGYDVGGIRFSVPIHFNAQITGDAHHQQLRATGDERTEIEVRVSHKDSPTLAAADARKLHASMPDSIPRLVRSAKVDYVAHETDPALFAIGQRTATGWRTELRGKRRLHGWRHDVVFSASNVVVAVSTVARSSNYDDSLRRLETLLERVPAEHIPGQSRTTIRNGLMFRYDANLELVASGDAPLYRYEFQRRGVAPDSFGELWVELRGDLRSDEREDVTATRIRNSLYGERQASSARWVDHSWMGSSVRGVEAMFVGSDFLDVADHHIMTTYAKPWGAHTLVAAFRGTRGESPELRGLLKQVMRGMEDVRGGTAIYRDPGVEYTVDPTLWVVEGDGQASTATLRESTLKTRWVPLGGRLLGPPPDLPTALQERVASDNKVRALLGEIEEPQWSDGEFEGGIPSKSAVVVYTDESGAQRFAVYLVADTATRRVWVTVDALLEDQAANESITAILSSVIPK